jgi:hypothetical protein
MNCKISNTTPTNITQIRMEQIDTRVDCPKVDKISAILEKRTIEPSDANVMMIPLQEIDLPTTCANDRTAEEEKATEAPTPPPTKAGSPNGAPTPQLAESPAKADSADKEIPTTQCSPVLMASSPVMPIIADDEHCDSEKSRPATPTVSMSEKIPTPQCSPVLMASSPLVPIIVDDEHCDSEKSCPATPLQKLASPQSPIASPTPTNSGHVAGDEQEMVDEG